MKHSQAALNLVIMTGLTIALGACGVESRVSSVDGQIHTNQAELASSKGKWQSFLFSERTTVEQYYSYPSGQNPVTGEITYDEPTLEPVQALSCSWIGSNRMPKAGDTMRLGKAGLQFKVEAALIQKGALKLSLRVTGGLVKLRPLYSSGSIDAISVGDLLEGSYGLIDCNAPHTLTLSSSPFETCDNGAEGLACQTDIDLRFHLVRVRKNKKEPIVTLSVSTGAGDANIFNRILNERYKGQYFYLAPEPNYSVIVEASKYEASILDNESLQLLR